MGQYILLMKMGQRLCENRPRLGHDILLLKWAKDYVKNGLILGHDILAQILCWKRATIGPQYIVTENGPNNVLKTGQNWATISVTDNGPKIVLKTGHSWATIHVTDNGPKIVENRPILGHNICYWKWAKDCVENGPRLG